ncbi:MAG: DUF5615 family PIN-like protein [Leptolyngbyaceae cyanobacterium CSU_1_4]|nr:DUF5615 family PIN-like protein [Leptolyngbyaceae cyanobacterium CSU_1_4]
MSLALYMDEHVHRAITVGLRIRGIDVLTVQEDGRNGVDDLIILDRASQLQRVIFSQDSDFLIEANRRQQRGTQFSGVLYAHQKLISIGNCIRDLEIVAQVSNPEDLADKVWYLPL